MNDRHIKVANKYQRGFTLVETSMVLVMISFLLSSMAFGISLVKNAQLRTIVFDFRTLDSAVKAFQLQYNYLPGDIPQATTIWPNATTLGGDGNNQINYASLSAAPLEDTYVFQHLVLAGTLPGSYSGGVAGSRIQRGVNSMASKIENGAYELIYPLLASVYTSVYNIGPGNVVQYGAIDNIGSGGGQSSGGIFNAKDAYNIDLKMDDGVASTGNLVTLRSAAMMATSTCVTGAQSVTTGVNYLQNDTAVSCRLFFYLTSP
jgi:prepilin-type N-terminal cleavage/methylation domain-containing protein